MRWPCFRLDIPIAGRQLRDALVRDICSHDTWHASEIMMDETCHTSVKTRTLCLQSLLCGRLVRHVAFLDWASRVLSIKMELLRV